MRRLSLAFIALAITLLLPLASARSASPPPPLRVTFIDVGQGDSILIQTPDGATALIDGGYPGSGTLAYLQQQRIARIDALIASHPHADHIGGLIDVLGALPVGTVYTSGASHTTGTFERFLDAIIAARVPYEEVATGDHIAVGGLAIDVLRGVPDAPNLNDTSLVLRLAYGQTSFLFTGDAERASEEALLASARSQLATTVLKVAHHGSHTSSSAAFLAAVRPQVAVYSAGRGNSYGHPHRSTIDALTAVGAAIYGTDRDGTITIATDGRTLTITSTLARQPAVIAATPAATVSPTMLPLPATPTPGTLPAPTARRAGNPCPSRMPNPPAPGGAIVITSVDKVAEIVEIRNDSRAALDVTGWAVCSVKGGQLHAWLAGAIDAGASLRIPSQAGSPIWNNRARERGAILDARGNPVSLWEEK